MTLSNMKFKISSPEQSERLQKVLFSLGYKWTTGGVQSTEKPHLYVYDNGLLMQGNCDRHFESKVFPEQDTDLFIASHESRADKMATMCFRDSDEGKAVFKGLETAWDEPLITENPWHVNNGTMPDLPEDTIIDAWFRDGEIHTDSHAQGWDWSLDDYHCNVDLIKWRFHKPEDAEGYEQPTPQRKVMEVCGVPIYEGAPPEGCVDLMQPKTEPDDVIMAYHKGEQIIPKTELRFANGTTLTFQADDYKWSDTEAPIVLARNKYSREIKPGVFCDVYDVLRAFNVTDGALAHLIKKALAVGQRGHKDATEDYQDIHASAVRALDLHKEWDK